jgi:two-component system chemotaxis response regulator CheB
MVSSLTAEGADTTLEALKLGAVDFVPKPDGAVTLHLDVFGPQFIAKVRSAAGAKLKASLRLRERIQRMTGVAPSRYKNRSGATTRVESRLKGFGLVLVGTSTGGPPALESLLMPLPATFPWPIVIAQHMPASFTGALARRLDGICALNVVEVVQGTKLEPGLAYIGRGDGDIVISAQGADLVAMPAASEANYLWHPSTDRLVRSAMQHVSPAQLVGILMTGMGNDGAEAMTQLHTLGGRTIAEAEETAAVWGMPGELVKAGGADWIVPVQNIAEKLQQMMPFDALNPKHA